MNICLYQSAASLSALERWQDVVTQNISSGQVPGYKQRTIEFSTIEFGSLQPDSKARMGSGDGKPSSFPVTKTGISFRAGESIPTRNDLDFAINGDGFFQVQMPDGSRAFTRSGELHLSPTRTLVTQDNYPVLSKGGTPITLQPENGSIAVSGDGAVSQGDTQLGAIGVVRFDDTSKLTPAGRGIYVLNDKSVDPITVDRPKLMQGYIEGSNVAPLQEMIALVQIARAYEANQKIITTRDQNLGKALEMLG
jgi:flagellar basal body rod protein FlgG